MQNRENTFWRAVYDSRHYSFEAYGFSETGAIAALRKGLEAHAATCGIDRDWFEESDLAAYPFNIDCAYRDQSELPL